MDQATAPRTVSGEELLGGQWTTEKRKRKPKKERRGNARLWVVLLVLAVVAAVGGYYLVQQYQKPQIIEVMESIGFDNITYIEPNSANANVMVSAVACDRQYVLRTRTVDGVSFLALAQVEEGDSFNYTITPCKRAG